MTVGELTRDIKTGKRWKDGQKIREADLEKKRDALKQRLINQGKLQEGEDLPKESSEAGTPVPNGSTPAPAQAPPSPVQDLPTGISIRVLNGQIVANEESAQYDRHAEAARNRGELEVREENEFSNRVNQQSHMKRLPPKSNWTHEETAKFYHGLRMFGTDFNMISKMFGGDRTRRQIKLKFNREERANPVGVNKCIIGEKDTAMDLDAVGGAEGLEDSKVIEDELARLREEREAETKRLEEELAAEAKRKRDELLGKRKGDPISGKDKGGKGQQSGHGGDGDMGGAPNGSSSAAAAKDKAKHKEEPNPGAKYGVGIDPDVIDETDLPTNSSYGRGTGRGRGGRGGRRGGKVSSVFASGFGV
ncbi:hypothetical protein M406DRAFT_284357 [Cryphonectria parasitica EP155]|uniref:SANT domain-containing protein n=1 Tax=Cryphonectria parasitica (strain ATCC 38755 / EP155) TaxID=660469 RepID=A0A9P5CT22_CRYP1|nr:uncharacterized protein M406DRAFT_284357 [Cryphonectria parasitica EP155]KAF3769878.1 hypothetical protein M406DRAFT_284357 [Cryphonectria parasitica EP155]